jgi:hypothetical protein
VGEWPHGPRTSNDPFTAPHFDSSALLVIDTQVDFLDGGASPIAGTSDQLPEMTRLVEAYRSAGRPIVHVIRLYVGDDVDSVRRAALQHGAPIVRPGSAGARIAPGLLPDPGIELDSDALLAGHLQQVGGNEVVPSGDRLARQIQASQSQQRFKAATTARGLRRLGLRGWMQHPD